MSNVRQTVREYTLQEVAEALHHLDYDDRDVWVKMALALKASFGEEAFNVWDEWSANSSSYKQSAARSVWKSAKAGALTVGTLIHLAKENGWKPGVQHIETQEQKQAREQRRVEREKMLEQEAAELKEYNLLVAEHCERLFDLMTPDGSSRYLGVKKIAAMGIRFCHEPILSMIRKDKISAEIFTDKAEIKKLLNEVNKTPKDSWLFSLRHITHGCFSVPMRDLDGKLWGLQIIFNAGGKSFFYNSRKSGCFHLIGNITPHTPLCVAEGYATGVSIHMATKYPVAIAFDVGNLESVAAALREKYPDQKIIICADDDSETKNNPGVTKAKQAAIAVGGICVVPVFKRGLAA